MNLLSLLKNFKAKSLQNTYKKLKTNFNQENSNKTYVF